MTHVKQSQPKHKSTTLSNPSPHLHSHFKYFQFPKYNIEIVNTGEPKGRNKEHK